MTVAPYLVPLVAGVTMAVLAVWLLRVNPTHSSTRAFAIVLVARASSLAALSTLMLSSSIDVCRVAAICYSATCLATIFGVLYFVAVYPARRAWLPRGWAGPASVFLPLAILELWLFAKPDLVRPMALLTGTGPLVIVRWSLENPQGPFGITPTLLDLSMAIPALVLARDFLRAPRGKRRSTLWIVSVGFFAPAACSCLVAGAILQFRGIAPRPAQPSLFNYLEMVAFGCWFFILTGLLAYLALHAIRAGERWMKQEALVFAAVLVASTLLGAVAGTIEDPARSLQAIAVMVGFWSALGAVLVTYGVLRYSLFDIDVTVRLSVQRSSVAAVFVGAYFLVSEVGTVWFSDVSGSEYWGIAAAGGLLLALRPIQGLAERLVDTAVPAGPPLAKLGREDQISFYREHVDLMWMDGHLSPKDRLVLASLRARLGLDSETAERIELEVLGGQ